VISSVSPESSLENSGGGELDLGENAPYRWGSQRGELGRLVAIACGGDDGGTASFSMMQSGDRRILYSVYEQSRDRDS
jgi:hypothetical protein